jgi:hypothetical protein
MKSTTKCLIVCASLALPFAASAQPNDQKYCSQLSNMYNAYIAGAASGKKEEIGTNIDATLAMNKCKAGDMTGIPVLEKALTNAKIALPARN